jgi:type I restriction enzyme R subunit
MLETPRFEGKTQNRVIQLFTGPGGLGYDYLGEWNKRDNNRALKQAMMQELLTWRTRLV